MWNTSGCPRHKLPIVQQLETKQSSESVWKRCAAWAWSLNICVSWPLLHKMVFLYCKPKRRQEIKRRSPTCAMTIFSSENDAVMLLSKPGWLCAPQCCVCVHACLSVQNCASVYAYVYMHTCARRCLYVSLCALAAVCWNSNLFTPQKSWYGPFTFWNEKQIQIQGQFPSPIICSHFKIKINFRSPCCSPLGLKYFLFECVWWKVFSAQPHRAAVMRGRWLCTWVCACVCVCHWNT